eukprot:8275511-Alexandrium_andersonii.AAC.1
MRATRRAISRKTGWQARGTCRSGAKGRRRRSARSHSRVWSRCWVHGGSSGSCPPAFPRPSLGVVWVSGPLELR